MLVLSTEKIAESEAEITCEDEAEIRRTCCFRKDAEKYPIFYKEDVPDTPVPESHRVVRMAIIGHTEFPKLSSLLIELEDGRKTRICAAYLNEMQGEDFGIGEEELTAQALSGDDLFE